MTVSDPMVPPPSARHAAVTSGEVFVWEPLPEISIQCARGVIPLSLARFVTELYRARLESGGRVTIFCEYSQITHYTREAREHVTEFVLAHRSGILALYFLIGSKLFALGVSLFKRATGDELSRVYSERRTFLDAYDRVVQARRAASPTSGRPREQRGPDK